MLTDEEIIRAGYMHTVEADEPLFTFNRPELLAMVRELLAAHSAKSHDAWKLAVDDELVTIGSTTDSFDSPKAAIAELIDWHVNAALDPAISKGAQDLIDKGKVSAGAQEPVGTAVNDEELGRFWEMHKSASEFPVGTHVYTHPQPMPQAQPVYDKSVVRRLATQWGMIPETDAARDALAEIITARKAMLKRIDDVHTADRQTGCNTFYDNDLERHTAILFRAIDAEIERSERGDRAEGE